MERIPRTQINEKTLVHLPRGACATIHALGSQKNDIQDKLLAMGILPGRMITVISKFPSFVFQIGNSQFTVLYRFLWRCLYQQ